MMARDNPWQQFRVNNNWGNLTYFLGAQQVDTKRSAVADVRWPDGTIERGVDLRPSTHTVQVHDSGHVYDVPQHRLVIEINYHGVNFLHPVDERLFVRNFLQE